MLFSEQLTRLHERWLELLVVELRDAIVYSSARACDAFTEDTSLVGAWTDVQRLQGPTMSSPST